MKAKVYDQIKTLVEVQPDFADQMIPKNTLGTIVECYENPEGYAVDTALPAIMQYSFYPCPLLAQLSVLRMYLIAAGSAVLPSQIKS